VYFRREGVSLDVIGWVSGLSLAWSLKVLWSPLVDRFGERRGWIAAALSTMCASLLLLAILPTSPPGLALWLALAAFCVASATQDVAIDAYTIGLTDRGEEGAVNAMRVAAYRLGLIAAGGGLLFLPRWVGWPGTYAGAAALTAALAWGVFAAPRVSVPAEARREFRRPLLRWLALPGAAPVLAFVLLYRLGDVSMGPMVKPLWVDRGFANEEIALVSTTLGAVATVVGAVVGGAVVQRAGIGRSLLWLGALALVSNLGYAAAAAFPESGRPGIYSAALVESFCAGLASAAFLSLLMRICEKEHAAVQYALLTALYALPGTVIGARSGWATEQIGYAAWFTLTAALALPAFAFLPWVRARAAE
jgi:PAT family beta-lactamase induction signal transducer AmpG